LPIDVDPESCDRVLDTVLPIANEHELSVYDAMYLELALRLRMPLATLDQKLIAAGKAAGVEVL
jgi:predicted nucleic acid-binding protein